MRKFKEFVEDAANSAGAGNIAGIGIGKDGEPGVRKDPLRRYKKANQSGEKKATHSVVMMALGRRDA